MVRELRGLGVEFTLTETLDVHKIEPQDQFVVIASDGLYEHFTPEQVTSFIGDYLRECKDSPTEVAKIGNRIIAKELETIAKLMRKTVDEGIVLHTMWGGSGGEHLW